MVWKDQCGFAAEKSLDSRLKAIYGWAGKATDVSYGLFTSL